MLEAAVTLIKHGQEKEIPIETVRRTQQRVMLLADVGQVPADPRHVDAGLTADGDCMLDAANVELANHQITDLDRVIDQVPIVRCRIGAIAEALRAVPSHRRGDAPLRT